MLTDNAARRWRTRAGYDRGRVAPTAAGANQPVLTGRAAEALLAANVGDEIPSAGFLLEKIKRLAVEPKIRILAIACLGIARAFKPHAPVRTFRSARAALTLRAVHSRCAALPLRSALPVLSIEAVPPILAVFRNWNQLRGFFGNALGIDRFGSRSCERSRSFL